MPVTRSTAKKERAAVNSRIREKPAAMRAPMLTRDKRWLAFMSWPKSTGCADSGESVLAEPLLEFRLGGLQGLHERLAVDILDQLHAGVGQPLEGLGRGSRAEAARRISCCHRGV